MENKKYMWIYWKEQCKYCKAQCSYIMKNNVAEFIKELSKIEKNTKFVYGTLKWSCDYF